MGDSKTYNRYTGTWDTLISSGGSNHTGFEIYRTPDGREYATRDIGSDPYFKTGDGLWTSPVSGQTIGSIDLNGTTTPDFDHWGDGSGLPGSLPVPDYLGQRPTDSESTYTKFSATGGTGGIDWGVTSYGSDMPAPAAPIPTPGMAPGGVDWGVTSEGGDLAAPAVPIPSVPNGVDWGEGPPPPGWKPTGGGAGWDAGGTPKNAPSGGPAQTNISAGQKVGAILGLVAALAVIAFWASNGFKVDLAAIPTLYQSFQSIIQYCRTLALPPWAEGLMIGGAVLAGLAFSAKHQPNAAEKGTAAAAADTRQIFDTGPISYITNPDALAVATGLSLTLMSINLSPTAPISQFIALPHDQLLSALQAAVGPGSHIATGGSLYQTVFVYNNHVITLQHGSNGQDIAQVATLSRQFAGAGSNPTDYIPFHLADGSVNPDAIARLNLSAPLANVAINGSPGQASKAAAVFDASEHPVAAIN